MDDRKTKTLTLDNHHNIIMNKINKNREFIPKYKSEITKLEKLLKTKKNDTFEITEKINFYKNKIKELENAELDYYLDNSKYIFEYFENKKAINTDNKTSQDEKINNFFNIKNDDVNDTNDNKINNILDKYYKNIHSDYLIVKENNSEDICNKCNTGEMIYNECEGIFICNKCYSYTKYYIETDKISYRDPPKEVSFYAYKRINHLKEIIAQFQAKESTKIPEYIFNNIKYKIKKERINVNELTNEKTKEILKNLGYNKYYEHIPFIKDKLGIKPPVMSNELENMLCNLFIEIQKPYAKYCPSDRVNFLNYYYTIYKLCELLGHTEFLQYFPMLKDREKRIEQDLIWKKICNELNWKFIATV